MIRNRLEWDRKTLARFLNISAKEVYYIELGKAPSKNAVKVLKRLEKYEPVIKIISGACSQFIQGFKAIFNIPITNLKRAKGELVGDQYVFDCCRQPLFIVPVSREFLVPLILFVFSVIQV